MVFPVGWNLWGLGLKGSGLIGETTMGIIPPLTHVGSIPKYSGEINDQESERPNVKDIPCSLQGRGGPNVFLSGSDSRRSVEVGNDVRPCTITYSLDNEEFGIITFDSYREEIDSRLHIEPRQPGQSSFRQLQEARASHINQERKAREEARAHMQNVLPDPAKVQAARELNNQYGALKNRHGIKNQ